MAASRVVVERCHARQPNHEPGEIRRRIHRSAQPGVTAPSSSRRSYAATTCAGVQSSVPTACDRPTYGPRPRSAPEPARLVEEHRARLRERRATRTGSWSRRRRGSRRRTRPAPARTRCTRTRRRARADDGEVDPVEQVVVEGVVAQVGELRRRAAASAAPDEPGTGASDARSATLRRIAEPPQVAHGQRRPVGVQEPVGRPVGLLERHERRRPPAGSSASTRYCWRCHAVRRRRRASPCPGSSSPALVADPARAARSSSTVRVRTQARASSLSHDPPSVTAASAPDQARATGRAARARRRPAPASPSSPSTSRWSKLSASCVTWRIWILPLCTHGCSRIAPNARIAASPGLRIGVPVSMPKTPDVGDRDGAVGHVRGRRLAGPRGRRELRERARQLLEVQAVRVLDVRHDEPAGGRRRDPEVDVVLVDDLLRRLVPDCR